MRPPSDRPPRGAYGIDAPGVVLAFVLATSAGLAVSAWQHSLSGVLSSALGAVVLACFLHTTRRGKFIVWRGVLDDLALTGTERVLDLGCGRGAVLLMAARRLTSGVAVGIDIWSATDQSGNARSVTEANAAREGQTDRVQLHTGDMRSLPFGADSFDVVISNVAIHNIPSADGRDQAIAEAFRVLKPGGRLRIADIRYGQHYRDRLRALGAREVSSRNAGWRMWWGGPWMSTLLISACK